MLHTNKNSITFNYMSVTADVSVEKNTPLSGVCKSLNFRDNHYGYVNTESLKPFCEKDQHVVLYLKRWETVPSGSYKTLFRHFLKLNVNG